MNDPLPSVSFSPDPIEAPVTGEVVEVPLLLPGWQITALETAAHDRGLTAGEMVRCLLQEFIRRLPRNVPEPDWPERGLTSSRF